jgi:hypothetical protein
MRNIFKCLPLEEETGRVQIQTTQMREREVGRRREEIKMFLFPYSFIFPLLKHVLNIISGLY